MVDVVELIDVHVHVRARLQLLELGCQFRQANERRRSFEIEVDPVVRPILNLAHLKMREGIEQLDERQAEPDEHALEQVGGHDHDDGDEIDQHLAASVLQERRHDLRIGELVAGEDEDRRQCRQRDVLERERQRADEQQQPEAMHDGRGARHGAGFDVGAGAHDDACHRQYAERAADGVADALRRQLAIVFRTRAAMHLIDGGGAQQRLGAGDEGDGDGTEQNRPLGNAHKLFRGRQNDFRPDVVRHSDVFDVGEAEQSRRADADDGAHQRRREQAPAFRGERIPAEDRRDCQGADAQSLEVGTALGEGVHQRRGDAEQVLDAGADRLVIEHDVELRGENRARRCRPACR